MPSISSVYRQMTAPYGKLEAWAYGWMVGKPAAEIFAPFLTPLLQKLPVDAQLLDVGCGGGHLLDHLAREYPSLRLQGIDLSASQVARARKGTKSFGGRVKVDVGSALALPFDNESFDAVISIASIKHWPDWEQGLREMLRVLRPGGEFYVAEADRGCRIEDARCFLRALKIPRPLRGFLFPILRTYILGIGWEIDEARKILDGLRLKEGRVDRLGGLPVLALAGTKISG